MTEPKNNVAGVVRRIMKKSGLDAVLVGNLGNMLYLSGVVTDFFSREDVKVLVTRRKILVITDPRYQVQVNQEARPGVEVVIFGGPNNLNEAEMYRRLFRRFRVKKLGVEGRDIDHDTVEMLQDLGVKTKTVTRDIFEHFTEHRYLRAIKTPEEIEIMRQAAQIGFDSLNSILRWIRPGVTEAEVNGWLTGAMEAHGACGVSFPAIVASGPNSASAHASVSDRAIQKGEPLLIDWGVLYKGANGGKYCSDESRTYFVGGEPSPEMRKIYNIVYEAQAKAIREARPGMTGRQIHHLAHDHIEKHGYGDKLGHGVGHGSGLEIHEAPALTFSDSPMADIPIAPGMVFTIEPGIYLEGKGGVRLEMMCVMTETGTEPIIDYGDRSLTVLNKED